ncbi:GGDEF domain-containing protein [Rhodopseudomonas palustris]|uniref:GGDEF domain-containing protein n=1 Tax=Rhodopseudomonas palustris TaxID=1076 RepID=UPI0020CE0C68|nr:GGDEF domain-containing protein [Rhodopseudomonas palustris]MCP9628884.1 GGDEF domain-containing protein [Rhodopseudomonas palustris]
MTSESKVANTVYIEFVRLLYTARWPIVVVGTAILMVGAAVGYQTGDLISPAIGVAGMLVTLARLTLCIAFDRTFDRRPLDLASAKVWERRLAVGVISTGICVGGFALRCFLLPDLTAHMVASGLVFGYCAGTTTRFSIRPWIVKASLAVSVIPAVGAALWNFDLMHAAQALLFLIFFFGGFELIVYIHNTTREQLTLRAEAAHLARADVLTKLPNRLRLSEHFDEAAARLQRYGEGFAVICIDLDFFKEANDRFGHAAGDEILQIVAMRLTGLLRPSDLAARVGGDEFIVIQADVDSRNEIEALCGRIVSTVSAPYIIDGNVVVLGACVGTALAPADGTTLDALLGKADAALYAAKRNRGGQQRPPAAVTENIPLAPELCQSRSADEATDSAARRSAPTLGSPR